METIAYDNLVSKIKVISVYHDKDDFLMEVTVHHDSPIIEDLILGVEYEEGKIRIWPIEDKKPYPEDVINILHFLIAEDYICFDFKNIEDNTTIGEDNIGKYAKYNKSIYRNNKEGRSIIALTRHNPDVLMGLAMAISRQ